MDGRISLGYALYRAISSTEPFSTNLPEHLSTRLAFINSEFLEGDITLRGYCRKTFTLLEQCLSNDIVNQISPLHSQLVTGHISEVEYCEQVIDILTTEPESESFVNLREPDQDIRNSTFQVVRSSGIAVNDGAEKIIIESSRPAAVGDEDEPALKKIKHGDNEESASIPEPTTSDPERCKICQQLLGPDLCLYPGHPKDAVEEFVALTDSRLSLFSDDGAANNDCDDRPLNKLTHFCVYDKEGHLCPFDSGLIERDVLLYVSGYIKAIYEESSSIENGIATMELGPINEWWISGFDGGELALIGINTAFGEYVLMEPSEAYSPFMETVQEKVCMSKLIIEFLNFSEKLHYEDLLNKLQATKSPRDVPFTEDDLIRHAQFICDQVQNFDSASLDGNELLITSPCIRTLMNRAGVTLGKLKAMRKPVDQRSIPKRDQGKGTTTDFICKVFETYTPEKFHGHGKQPVRRRRCGICEVCLRKDCGKCSSCRDMTKYGGSGRSKQACNLRRCPNLALQEAEDSDPEDEGEYVKVTGGNVGASNLSWLAGVAPSPLSLQGRGRTVNWLGEPIGSELDCTFYSQVCVGRLEVAINDYVFISPRIANLPPLIAQVVYMWEDGGSKEKMFHAHWLIRGVDTILGELSDPREVFLTDLCNSIPLGSIIQKISVINDSCPDNWTASGGRHSEKSSRDDRKSFYYQKIYYAQSGRFEDPHPDISPVDKKPNYCLFCKQGELELIKHSTPVIENVQVLSANEVKCGELHWRGEVYQVGNGVYLDASTFQPCGSLMSQEFLQIGIKEPVDEDLHPEFYRKSLEQKKDTNEESHALPFCIGYVSDILAQKADQTLHPKDVLITVNRMYRPEDTHQGKVSGHQHSINMLYWSDEELKVTLAQIMGRCHIMYTGNLDLNAEEWITYGPNRFFFDQAYSAKLQIFYNPPARFLSSAFKNVKEEGVEKEMRPGSRTEEVKLSPDTWPFVLNPLRALDVFAGCGGFTEGLTQSGVSQTYWAIEKDEAAASAFHLNHPASTVFSEDCSLFLKRVMKGEKNAENGQILPQKGEVDLICGSPPCRGFRGKNSFNSRHYSLFKNSAMATYLSICEFYRPRFIIMDSIHNFLLFKKSMVLKFILLCLVRMGYQCMFGVLQAGNFGVPQNCRRFYVMAAGPGEKLPQCPEPVYSFTIQDSQFLIDVDGKRFSSPCKWIGTGPLRMMTVQDFLSDLPDIVNGHCEEEMPYEEDKVPSFTQFKIRDNQEQPVLRDHICKLMPPLVEARIANIPTDPGSDWRDLPNIQVKLSDGSVTKKLVYSYHDKATGKLRGVCSCSVGKNCNLLDQQHNTLIPWCLPHTADKHNQWAGLYGRLDWNDVFSTPIRNPEPMGKQGRVLHPEQTRVVSVRECARSQGFLDTYRFYGSILEKYCQVGNAVPPPVGCAIGFEILKCVASAEGM